MRKIREAARLNAMGLSVREISVSCGVSRSTVCDYLKRLEKAGLQWPFDGELSDTDIEVRLFGEVRAAPKQPLDFQAVHTELKRKGVTLKLLWREYRREHPEGYGYSRFCELYHNWKQTLEPVMRQTHRGGEKLFVDYAGMTMRVRDGRSGEDREVQIFVAALGASQYIYAEATWSQRQEDWLGSHVRTYEYIGGVPEQTVPDNLRSGVSRACRYEPEINPAYAELAVWYGTAVVPARVGKPRDKAKVESAVQIVEREILSPLRDRVFFSLGELNAAMREKLNALNTRRFQKLDVSRRELFEELDRPALRALPEKRYEYGEFFRAKVNIDYHVEIKGHCYSVPYKLTGQRVDVRRTARQVEILHDGKRVAVHLRDDRKGVASTRKEHMPEDHQRYLEWTPSRLVRWAGSIGPHCARAVERILKSKEHPEQGYRACLGVMRLAKSYTSGRVEAACRRAVRLDVCSYRSIKNILESGKDAEELPDETLEASCVRPHENVRGGGYYREREEVCHAV